MNIVVPMAGAGSRFEKAGYSAYRERSIGLGAMGFHTYLQKLNIPNHKMLLKKFQIIYQRV